MISRLTLVIGSPLFILGSTLVIFRWFSTGMERLPQPMTPAQVLALKGAEPREVTLKDATPLQAHQRYRSRESGDFYTSDPRSAIPLGDVEELARRSQELEGSIVQIQSVPPLNRYFYEVKKNRQTGKVRDTATQLYAPLKETGDRVWILSERLKDRNDPKGKEFLSRNTHTGRLVRLSDAWDASILEAAYRRLGGKGLPATSVALDTEEPLPPRAAVDLWRPVDATQGRLWLVSPKDVAPSGTWKGVLRRLRDPLLDQEAERALAQRGPEHKDRWALYLMTASEFREMKGIQRFSWVGGSLTVMGLALLVLAGLRRDWG